MSTPPDSGYLTFVSTADRWSCYRGIGTNGPVAARRLVRAPLAQFAGSARPTAFGCYQPDSESASVLIRIDLTTLDSEEVGWSHRRIGAVACDPEGRRVAVVKLPESPADQPNILLSEGDGWTPIASTVVPDISSGLAWVGLNSVAFETSERRLAVVDLRDGSARPGMVGSAPAGVPRGTHWYAVVEGKPVVFTGPELGHPDAAAGFRVTARPYWLQASADGRVLSWKEPHGAFKSRAFVQRQFGDRIRVREADAGLAAVIGPLT